MLSDDNAVVAGWDPGPPDSQNKRNQQQASNSAECTWRNCDREEYVSKAEYDELKAKYERLQYHLLRVCESTDVIAQIDPVNGIRSGLVERRMKVEGLQSPTSHPVVNTDMCGSNITEVGRDVHYHLLTISTENMTIAILVFFFWIDGF